MSHGISALAGSCWLLHKNAGSRKNGEPSMQALYTEYILTSHHRHVSEREEVIVENTKNGKKGKNKNK